MEKDPIFLQQLPFKLPYQQCKHHGEKLNYICLDSKCHQSSIICSICKDQQHSMHHTRPLKFYLSELEKKYHKVEGQSNLNELLEELQVSEFTFCQQLKKAVENVASSFQRLEEDVMQQISRIRNQIFQEIAKRNRFSQFYDNLRKGRVEESNFMVQNYLPQATIGSISNFKMIEKISQKMCGEISLLKKSLFSRQTIDNQSKGLKRLLQRQDSQSTGIYSVFNIQKYMKTPSNIKFNNSVLVQQKSVIGTKTLCLIDYPVTQISGKINFLIQQRGKNAQIIISVMTKQVYQTMNETWIQAKLKLKQSFVIKSSGNNFGWDLHTITQFGQGSTLSLSYQSNELKIVQKSKQCKAKISPEAKLYIVLALIDECEVKVTHKM